MGPANHVSGFHSFTGKREPLGDSPIQELLRKWKDFPGCSGGNEPACNAGDLGSIPGSRRSAEDPQIPKMRWLDGITNSMEVNWSRLQETVEDRGACVWQSKGFTESWTWLSYWASKNWIPFRSCPERRLFRVHWGQKSHGSFHVCLPSLWCWGDCSSVGHVWVSLCPQIRGLPGLPNNCPLHRISCHYN